MPSGLDIPAMRSDQPGVRQETDVLRNGDKAKMLRIAEVMLSKPGGLWKFLSTLAWADTGLVRFHVVPLEVNLQGVVAADANPLPAESTVLSGSFYFVRRMVGFVEQDPTNGLEEDLGPFVTVQIRDQERKFDLGLDSWNMASMWSPNGDRSWVFDDFPPAFWPRAVVRATFVARNGFPVIASALTGLTTRRVGVTLQGALVDQQLVDSIVRLNGLALLDLGLLGSRT